MTNTIIDLYFKIEEFHGDNIFANIIKNWALENNYSHYISTLSSKVQNHNVGLSQDEIWELYALSRILDILTLGFQPDNLSEDSKWENIDLTVQQYIEFSNLIGLETSTPQLFNPFNCEIIEAQKGKNNFNITQSTFPAVKLKNLMIKRAGVIVTLNPELYDLNLANHSAIYWAFKRNNRKYFDMSQGWGSNSQWRTELRLDIETHDSFIYNLLGEHDLNKLPKSALEQLGVDALEIEEAIELTKFRHFVKCTKNDSDLFPYDYKYIEPKT